LVDVLQVLDVYNHRLGDNRYLAGDEFTLADLTHLPNSQYIATSEDWGHLFYERENVQRWWEEVSTRPSWTKVLDDIERSEEDEEEDGSSMQIIGPTTKMSLKASTFQPIKEIEELPAKSKSIFTISKNVARPRGSVQVSVPDKRGPLVSVPHKKGVSVSDAIVTVEDSTIPPTDTQISPTDHIDKVRTEPTKVGYQSTRPVTDAKVTIEGSTIPPTGAQIPSIARNDKNNTEPTGAVPQSTKSVIDDKVPPTPEPTSMSDKANQKSIASQPVETGMSRSHGFLLSQEPTPTSKTVQPMKVSMKNTQATPTEKTTTKPLTKDQGQTFSPPTSTDVHTHEIINKSAEVTKKYTASPTDETSVSKSHVFPFTKAPLPASKTKQPINPSLEDTQVPSTEKTTTKPLTRDQGRNSAKEPKRSKTGEELTSKKDKTDIDAEAYLAAKHNEWDEQWRKPEKFSGESHVENIPDQKPKPQKIEDNTPSITPTPTKHSETVRQEPVTSNSTDAPAKEPSEKAPDQLAKQTKGTSSLTTQNPAAKTTSQTVRAAPTTDKSMAGPAKEPSKSKDPVPEDESSRGRASTKQQERAPAAGTAQTITVPSATQLPPQPSINGTTGGVANRTNGASAKSSTANIPTATAEPMINKSNAALSKETMKPTVPAREDISQGSSTKEPKEMPTLATETETTGTRQTPPAIAQATPIKEAAAGTTDVTQMKTTPDELKKASADTKLGDDLAQNSQADTQKTSPVEGATARPQVTPAEKQHSVDKIGTEKTEDEISSSQRSKDILTSGKTSTQTASSEKVADQGASSEGAKDEVSKGTAFEAKTPSSNNQKEDSSTTPDTTDVSQMKTTPDELKKASADTKLGDDLAQNSQADTQKTFPVGGATARPQVTPAEKQHSVDNIGTEKTEDVISSSQTPKDILMNGKTSTQTTSSEKVADQGASSGAKDEVSKGTAFEAKTPSSNNQKEGSSTASDTTDVSQMKTTPDELKKASADTKLGDDLAQNSQADTQKTSPVGGATARPQLIPSERQHSVDKIGTEKTEDEISSSQTPKDILTNGETSTQTTSSEKVADQGAFSEGEKAKGTAFEAKIPSSNNQKEGSSTIPDTTHNKQETQNEKKMEIKTESGQQSTNKPNQSTSQSNKTIDANRRNETLSETNQNEPSLQGKATTSLNESSPNRNGRNSEPDPINNPKPPNLE
jgi:Glutathione S-transferase, C-terminal domain